MSLDIIDSNRNLKFKVSDLQIPRPGVKDDYYGYWITRADGEGVMLQADVFVKAFEKLYEENF